VADAITLKQLRILGAVDAAGSLAGAAGLVHLTPPAVHAQIRALEEIVGCRLVTRGSGTRAHLTAEGRRLCTAQATIAAALDKALADVDSLRSGQQGEPSDYSSSEGSSAGGR
jgi:molybdate transport repressor ModE-like protein